MGRLLLVRHGQSVWNRDGIIQGQAGPGLTPLGKAQAEALGRRLAAEEPDAVLVTSDLDRCRETIAPLEELLGRRATLDERVRERHFGSWQGMTHDEVRAADGDRYDRWTSRFDVVEEVGGETTSTLVERVVPALREHAAAAPVTVVSTHGGPVWHGVQALLGIPERTLGPVANASLATLDVDHDGATRLITWNAQGHLAPADRTSWRRASTSADEAPDRG